MKKRIFLDYSAGKANPDAIYKEGRDAKEALAQARARIARLLAVADDEVKLVSGSSELYLALFKFLKPADHIVTTSIEHESLLALFTDLEQRGVSVTYIKPNREGLIGVSDVERALRKNTRLVSIMYANNEIGTIEPIKEISRVLRRRRLPPAQVLGKNPQTVSIEQSSSPILHSDCVQAPGLLPINMQSLGVDIASFSATKFGGSVGAGFVYVRRSVTGLDIRESVALDLAIEMADKLVQVEKRREREVARLTKLRNYFIARVLTCGSDPQVGVEVGLNGSQEHRLANNINITFPIEAELLVLELDHLGICASVGSACSNRRGGLASPKPCEGGSHVILALGKSAEEARNSVRFSLGRLTSKSDLDYVLKVLPKIINKHTNIWIK